MKRKTLILLLLSCIAFPFLASCAQGEKTEAAYPVADNGDGTFKNPVIWADVPDLCLTRVDDTYYMVSTTMHMTPGIPVMRSYDLVNWEIISYCYPRLEDRDENALKNGKSDYSWGSWASNIRYDKELKRFFVITACQTTDKSYFFSTDDIENGAWHMNVTEKCYDPGLLFEEGESGNKRWVLYGQQNQHYREIFVDKNTFDVTLGPERLWKETCDHENKAGVWVEGAQSIKVGDYYYLFMIALRDGRTQIVWRGKDVNDPDSWEARRVFFHGQIQDKEGKDVMPSSGIAQGGIVSTPNGNWYALLFQDNGAVGRIPVLIPVQWTEDHWPVLGNQGVAVDEILPMPGNPQKQKTNIVTSDEFNNDAKRLIISDKELGTGVTAGLSVKQINDLFEKANGDWKKYAESIEENEYGYNGSNLKLQWQWNHNPNNNLWSLTDRKGWLRLKSGVLANNIRDARNTLTQRTFGPTSSASTLIDVSQLKDGDVTGIAAFANQYGFVGVTMQQGQKYIIMQRAQKKDDTGGQTMEKVPMEGNKVLLKVDCDFGYDKKDEAYFYYSSDNGKTWDRIGDTLKMVYDWPDFMGYRFGLFYFSTRQPGGCADFDYFRVDNKISGLK